MEKIYRKVINEISTLKEYETTLSTWCEECLEETRQWRSSGNIYKLLKSELSNLTDGHCSFCDGYPLNNTSKDTIEHYYPKNQFKEKTYLWGNLFLCCDKCQSESNKTQFQYSLKPDDENYYFEKYFYFDAKTGEVKVLENLEDDNPDFYTNALLFLKRYGINSNEERLMARRKLFKDILFKIKNNDADLNRIYEPNRFVYDEALKSYEIISKIK